MVPGISDLEIVSCSDCGTQWMYKDDGSVALKGAIPAVMCVGVCLGILVGSSGCSCLKAGWLQGLSICRSGHSSVRYPVPSTIARQHLHKLSWHSCLRTVAYQWRVLLNKSKCISTSKQIAKKGWTDSNSNTLINFSFSCSGITSELIMHVRLKTGQRKP